MTVNIKFDFLYETEAKSPERAWKKLMNIVLDDKSHNHLMEMVDFTHHEYEIINKKMPLMFRPEQIKKLHEI